MATVFVKHNSHPIPETKVGVAGSSKRNILRRGAPPKERKAGAPTNVVDDGTGYNDSPALDEQDPNYDSEHETPREAARFTRPTSGSMDVGAAKMTLQKFKHLVEPLIHEYFVSGDAVETLTSLQELDAAQYSYEFVKRVVNMSLDKSDRERELVSRLLSTAYPDTLSSNSIGKGFERLLELSDEIEKDAPAAKDMMATFLARAVIDEILPPSFIADPVVANLGGEIIDHTKVMLSRDHAGAKLERIWGPGDGRPVEEMKLAVDQLLLEYVAARQVEEAARCVKQLNAPLFHHELVKRLLVIALEKSEEDRNALSELLIYLMEEDIVSQKQFVKGFDRTFSIMSDLVLDQPAAPAIVEALTCKAIEDKVLPDGYFFPH